MHSPLTTHNSPLSARRGFIAITLAVIVLALVFSLISLSALHMTAATAQLHRVERETQALYAAEAGLDLALQTGNPNQSGLVGAARFLVTRRGQSLISLARAEQTTGASALAAVTISLTPGGAPNRATWRQVPPGQYPDLLARLQTGM